MEYRYSQLHSAVILINEDKQAVVLKIIDKGTLDRIDDKVGDVWEDISLSDTHIHPFNNSITLQNETT